jgi:Zn-dependent protease with chaperone function
MSQSEPSLESGLAALKGGDYQTAKTILAVVAKTTDRTWATLQAQIGLVVAHTHSGEIDQAIALCEILIHSNHPQVKPWAVRSLAELNKHNISRDNSHTTGFVPFDDGEAYLPPQFDLPPLPQLSAPPPPPPLPPARGQIVKVITPIKPQTIFWRQAGRAKVWEALPSVNLIPLWLLSGGTFVALFWVTREIVNFITASINNILVWLPFLEPIQFLYQNPTSFLLFTFFVITGLSPWLLDWWLQEFYGLRNLEKSTLETHSPESTRVIQRYSQQRGLKFPQLRILPTSVPMAFTYGNLPRTTRLVVTQGLLEQLSEEEIATIYAGQLAHVIHWNHVVMSSVLVITLPIYNLYQQVSLWGDRIANNFIKFIFIALSSITYVAWCLLTGTAILLSKIRPYYSDRFICDFTGNPNALSRALLKLNMGIADEIHKQEQTPWQLESLNISLPVGFQQSITLGSLAPNVSLESLLMWDYLNPYRFWFTINNTHPLIGDRIQRLCHISRRWRLETELNIETSPSIPVHQQSFYRQIAPFLGIPCGIAAAVIINLGWQIAFALKIINLKWIYDDISFAFGCALIGLSIGILVRINSLFPELKSQNLQTNEHLPTLLNNPAAIPQNSTGVRIEGKLIGIRGVSNSLGQDLILQTSTVLIKLHHTSWMGQSVNPQDLIGRQVTVTGWLRRGATPWLDMESLETQSGKTIISMHQVWSVVIAVVCEAWGAYILLKG